MRLKKSEEVEPQMGKMGRMKGMRVNGNVEFILFILFICG
jgi:hypothetical protein